MYKSHGGSILSCMDASSMGSNLELCNSNRNAQGIRRRNTNSGQKLSQWTWKTTTSEKKARIAQERIPNIVICRPLNRDSLCHGTCHRRWHRRRLTGARGTNELRFELRVEVSKLIETSGKDLKTGKYRVAEIPRVE